MTIEQLKQNLLQAKQSLEDLHAERIRLVTEELERNRSLLVATQNEAEQAQQKRVSLIKSGVSPFNKAVKAERDKEIAALATADDIGIAIRVSECTLLETEIQLSSRMREFDAARSQYIKQLADDLVADFIANPDDRLILAVHLLATEELKDPFSIQTQINILNSAAGHGFSDHAAMFRTKLELLFQSDGVLRALTTIDKRDELVASTIKEEISTVARYEVLTPGQIKQVTNQLEQKRNALVEI